MIQPFFQFSETKKEWMPLLRRIQDRYTKTHKKLPSRPRGSKETTKAKARSAKGVCDGGLQFEDNQNGRPSAKNAQIEERHGSV